MTRTRKQDQGIGWLKRMLDALRGGGIALCTALAVLGLTAIMMRSGLLGSNQEGSAVITACLLGGLAGGLAAAWKGGTASLSVGLGTGAVFFLLLLTGGLLFYQNPATLRSAGGMAAACLCGGGLAGVLCRSKGSKKRRRR